ncbi:MAG: hypothetical protein PHG67_02250 [Bacteroidales bacterium]|nr:hypothetical protein [Bacteroidales bacterium]HOI32293.1 hypothetical protein [Bacteroidales bacterium]
MIHFLAIIFLVLPTEQPELLNEARKLYFRLDQPGCVSEKLFEILQQNTKKTAVLLAYEGAAEASSASCAVFPLNKLKRFNQGKQKIELALKLDSLNSEIRFIRFSIQSRAPAFLGYHDDIEKDLAFLMNKFTQDQTLFEDDLLRGNIIRFLIQSSQITDQQIALLQKMLNAENN